MRYKDSHHRGREQTILVGCGKTAQMHISFWKLNFYDTVEFRTEIKDNNITGKSNFTKNVQHEQTTTIFDPGTSGDDILRDITRF